MILGHILHLILAKRLRSDGGHILSGKNNMFHVVLKNKGGSRKIYLWLFSKKWETKP